MSRFGSKLTILGSSFSTQPDSQVIAALRQLPPDVTICARDPISRDRMQQALDRPIKQVADLAFLVEPDFAAANRNGTLDWIETRRAAGDSVIAFNMKSLGNAGSEGLVAAISRLITSLVEKSFSILMLPHDIRPPQSDVALLEEAVALLSVKARQRVRMIIPESPSMVKAVLAKADLLVTGRMHAGILAMGAGTPAVSFSYQGKFEGLYTMLGLPQSALLLDPNSLVNEPEKVEAAILTAHTNRAALRQVLAQNLPRVMELARGNFDFVAQD
jgi:polysaccharide pyruvyl transferase WcaK-like protein